MTSQANTANGIDARLRGAFDFMLQVWAVLTSMATDIAVTALTLAVAASIYFTYWPSLVPWAMFTTFSIYMVLMLLRILDRIRRDDLAFHSTSEVGEMLITMDHEITERLDAIERNV